MSTAAASLTISLACLHALQPAAAQPPANPRGEPAVTPQAPPPVEAAAVEPPSTVAVPPVGDARDTSGWRAELFGWIWLVGLTGDVRLGRLSADVDATFAEIVDDSDSLFALSGRLEVGHGRLGGYIDGFYADIGAEDQSGPPGFAAVDFSTEELIIDFGMTYRLAEWTPGKGAGHPGRKIGLDLCAGVRYSDLDVTIDPARVRSRSRQESLIDPIIGARLVLPIAERWSLAINGDVGGFGASSDLTWSATGVFGFDFHIGKMPATAYLGYRAIGWESTVDSGRDEFTWDMVEHGPLIGLGLRF
ncbi:MAG: hypothetical protein IT438_11720 [Phycisphaerales bacterium]|nr:hypothetical protein [Phycisphaerales bacterium]